MPLSRLVGFEPGVRFAVPASDVEGSACSRSASEGFTSSGWSSIVSPPLEGAVDRSREVAMPKVRVLRAPHSGNYNLVTKYELANEIAHL